MQTAMTENADIVMLQEACSHDHISPIDLINQFSKLFQIEWRFQQQFFTHWSYGQYREDLIILSRHFPISTYQSHIPYHSLGRGVVALKLPDSNYWLANTHLSHLEDSSERTIQISNLVQKFKNDHVIFLGDFNSGPSDPESEIWKNANYRPYFPGKTWPAHQPKIAYDGAWAKIPNQYFFDMKTLRHIGSDHLGILMRVHPLF